MFPLSTTSPVPLYAMQQYKCLVAALEKIEKETDEDCMYRFKQPCTLVSYKGEFQAACFSPREVIRNLIDEVEALQDHIRAREEGIATRVDERATHIRLLESELKHLRSLAFS